MPIQESALEQHIKAAEELEGDIVKVLGQKTKKTKKADEGAADFTQELLDRYNG